MECVREVLLFYTLFTLSILCSFATSTTMPLKFLLMVDSESSPDSSSAVVPAVDQTLEEVNKDTSILPEHHLEYILRNSKCNETMALRSFFDIATDSSVKAVVGCGCSTATEVVAKVSHYFNTPVISYASTSVVLSDKSVYRSFFRTVPSDELLVSAVATIMNHYGWRQLSVFTEEQPQYLELFHMMSDSLEHTVNISDRVAIDDCLLNYTKLAGQVKHIFDAQPHIYLIIASKRTAIFILCAAYHNGRYYPNYAWILLGHHETDWWREHYMETNCSNTDMMKVLNRSLILIPYPDNSGNPEKYTEQIQEGDLYNVSVYASDAVRALAKALHTCINSTEISKSCMGAELDWNFTFTGRTGVVQIDPFNGNRIASTTLVCQYLFEVIHTVKDNYDPLTVGVITTSANDTHRLTFIGNYSMWPDGVPPDGIPVRIFVNVQTFIFVFQFSLAGLSLIGIAICLGFIIIFRNRKIIKLTSPNLNYVLLFGLALGSVSPLTYPSTEYTVVVVECTNTKILSSLGYDLVIGVALIKIARVYYIFKNPSANKKLPKDWQLLLGVLAIAMVELSFAIPLITLVLVDGDIRHEQSTDQQPAVNSQGVLEIPYYLRCNSSIFSYVYAGIAIAYKLALQIAALVFAWLIRKVQVTVLNDSRETVATIYSTTVLLVTGTFIVLVLTPMIERLAITWSTMLFLIVVINLGFTFVTKMVALYKDPQGEKIFKKTKQAVVNGKHENNHYVNINNTAAEIAAQNEQLSTSYQLSNNESL